MPDEPPQTAGRAEIALDGAGFCDQVFDAYYRGAATAGSRPSAAGRTGEPPAPRSRNSYMRTRARRLAAARER